MASLTFDDLRPVDIIAELQHGDRNLEIPLRTLTYAQWNQIGIDIPAATPPPMGVDKNNRPIFDYNNPQYIAQMEEVGQQRTYARLLASLRIEVPGTTKEEKIKSLRESLDANVVRQLLEVIGQFALKGEARVKHRAETFHEAGDTGTESFPTDGTFKDSVQSSA